MNELMTQLPEEIKEEIIATQPAGIWTVLAEEIPSEQATAGDLLGVPEGELCVATAL